MNCPLYIPTRKVWDEIKWIESLKFELLWHIIHQPEAARRGKNLKARRMWIGLIHPPSSRLLAVGQRTSFVCFGVFGGAENKTKVHNVKAFQDLFKWESTNIFQIPLTKNIGYKEMDLILNWNNLAHYIFWTNWSTRYFIKKISMSWICYVRNANKKKVNRLYITFCKF